MRIRFAALFLLGAIGSAYAEGRVVETVVDPDYLASIVDDEMGPPLPRGFGAGERARWQLPATLSGSMPPMGQLHTPAEYEFNDGLLMRWGSFNSLITEMAVAITTIEAEAKLFLVVGNASQQNSASATLSGAGADLSRVEFVQAPTDSVWMRDYGPRFIEDQFQRAIVDHAYNRPRPRDNAIPAALAGLWGDTRYEIGLTHGGGNFHLFDDGDAFMTRLINDENPGLSDQEIADRYVAYQNLGLTLVPAFPQSFDSTQHIDMWMLPVARKTVILSRYPQSAGSPHTITENLSTDLANSGYQVLRTDGWQASGSHYTYTNSVILNRLVLMCRFNGYESENAAALAVFQQAFPNHVIAQVDCSTIIHSAGAIHCIVMHVPAVGVLFRDGLE